MNHVLYNIKRLAEEKVLEEENFQKVQALVAELKEAVDELRAQQNSARAELNEINAANNALQNQIYKTEKDLDILQIQQQALEQESQRNLEDTSNKETELSHFNQVVAELQYRAESMDKELQTMSEAEDKLQLQIKEAESESEGIKETVIKESRKLDAKQNEYNLTKSMVDNLEGFPESIRFLKKTSGWAKNAPLFSDVLFCREEYRVAIENYLAPLMNYYVVEDYNEAIAAINLLSNSSQGRAQFFILSNYNDQANSLTTIDGAIAALDVIEVEPRYQNLCNHLLRNVYLVNDSAEKDLNGAVLPDGVVVIGKSGKFNKSKLTMAGGSVGLFECKRIGRARNLDNLAKEIKSIENKINEQKNRQNDLQNKLSALKLLGFFVVFR